MQKPAFLVILLVCVVLMVFLLSRLSYRFYLVHMVVIFAVYKFSFSADDYAAIASGIFM